MNSPTQRSLKKLRSEGWHVAVVERWNQWAKCRQDLFGFIDLLALKDDLTLAVQTTSGAHVAARLEKMKGIPTVALWLKSPTRLLVIHGWRKVGPRGTRKMWECRQVVVSATSQPPNVERPSQPDSRALVKHVPRQPVVDDDRRKKKPATKFGVVPEFEF